MHIEQKIQCAVILTMPAFTVKRHWSKQHQYPQHQRELSWRSMASNEVHAAKRDHMAYISIHGDAKHQFVDKQNSNFYDFVSTTCNALYLQ